MPVQRKVAHDSGIEQMQKMCYRRHPESRRELPRHRGAADPLRGFKHQHLAAGAGQIGGAHQAVVARADDDDPVAISHRSILPEP